MPAELFRDGAAWSVDLNPKHWTAPDLEEVRVKVWPLDEDYVRAPAALPVRDLEADRFMLSFRPERAPAKAGYLYWVEVSGLIDSAGEPAPLAYLVHFVDRVAPAEEAAEGGATDG